MGRAPECTPKHVLFISASGKAVHYTQLFSLSMLISMDHSNKPSAASLQLEP